MESDRWGEGRILCFRKEGFSTRRTGKSAPDRADHVVRMRAQLSQSGGPVLTAGHVLSAWN